MTFFFISSEAYLSTSLAGLRLAPFVVSVGRRKKNYVTLRKTLEWIV